MSETVLWALLALQIIGMIWLYDVFRGVTRLEQRLREVQHSVAEFRQEQIIARMDQEDGV